jgi:prevent-host-death family protein
MWDGSSYDGPMRQIGIRELIRHASRVIDRVRNGEVIEVTDRGQLVARVVPITERSELLGRLVQEGHATPPEATGKIPLPPAAGDATRSASEHVADDRLHERW